MLSDSVAEAFGLIHRHPRVKISAVVDGCSVFNLLSFCVHYVAVSSQGMQDHLGAKSGWLGKCHFLPGGGAPENWGGSGIFS